MVININFCACFECGQKETIPGLGSSINSRECLKSVQFPSTKSLPQVSSSESLDPSQISFNLSSENISSHTLTSGYVSISKSVKSVDSKSLKSSLCATSSKTALDVIQSSSSVMHTSKSKLW